MSKYKILLMPEGRCLSEGETNTRGILDLSYSAEENVNNFYKLYLQYMREDPFDGTTVQQIKEESDYALQHIKKLKESLQKEAIFMSYKKAQKGLQFYLDYNAPEDKKYQLTEFEFIKE